MPQNLKKLLTLTYDDISNNILSEIMYEKEKTS